MMRSEPAKLGTQSDRPRSFLAGAHQQQGRPFGSAPPRISEDNLTLGGRGSSNRKNAASSTKDAEIPTSGSTLFYSKNSFSSAFEAKADAETRRGPTYINRNTPPPELEQATFRERMNQLILEHELLLMEHCELHASCEGDRPQPPNVFGGRQPGEQATAEMYVDGDGRVSKRRPSAMSKMEQTPEMNQGMSPKARSSLMDQMRGSSSTMAVAGSLGMNRTPWRNADGHHISTPELPGGVGAPDMGFASLWDHMNNITSQNSLSALAGPACPPHRSAQSSALPALPDRRFLMQEGGSAASARSVDLSKSCSARSSMGSSLRPEELLASMGPSDHFHMPSGRSHVPSGLSLSPLARSEDLVHLSSAPPALGRQDQGDEDGMSNGPYQGDSDRTMLSVVRPQRSGGTALMANVMPMPFQMPGNLGLGMGNLVTRIASLSSSRRSLEGDVEKARSDVSGPRRPARKLPRLLWAFAWLLFVALELFLVPFQALFLGRPLDSPAYAGIMSLVSVFFALDMVANFFTAYACDEDRMAESRRRVATRYLKSWFLVDFVAFLPLELLVNDYGRANAILHLLKLPTSLAVAAKAHREQEVKSSGLSGSSRTLGGVLLGVSVIFLAGLLAHLNSFLLAAVAPSLLECLPSVSSKYGEAISITLVYMTTDTSTSSSCGRALADLPELRVLQVMISLQRMALISAVCLACVREVLRGWTQDSMQSSLMWDNALRYMRQQNVSHETQMSVLRCAEDNRKIGVLSRHFGEVSGELPVLLVRKISREMWEARLNTLQLIRHISEWDADFMADLVMMVHEENLAANMVIFNPEDRSCFALYIIEGVLHCPRYDLMTFTKGQWIGEMSLINLDFQRGNLVATKTSCRLMVLSASGFQELVASRGLADQFTELCKSILFSKACDRGGGFGDHDSGTMGVKYNSGTMLEGQETMEDVCWGLEKFLSSNHLEHLTSTMRPMGIFTLEDLVQALQDMDSFKERLVQAWEADSANPQQADPRRASRTNSNDECILSVDRSLGEREWEALTIPRVERFRAKLFANFQVTFQGCQRNEHLVFLCHYKIESGTEAALIRQEIETAVRENGDPSNLGKLFNTPAFLDSEDLQDLHLLQGQVHKCHNVFLLLTRNVLTRPWCLVEIVTACRLGVNVIPVEVVKAGSTFNFPNIEFYDKLLSGKLLNDKDLEVLTMCKLTVQDVVKALKLVFQKIALSYSPHKMGDFRRLEVESMLERCSIVEGLCNKSYKLDNLGESDDDGMASGTLSDGIDDLGSKGDDHPWRLDDDE